MITYLKGLFPLPTVNLYKVLAILSGSVCLSGHFVSNVASPTMIRFQIRTSIAFGNLVGYLGSGWQKSIFNEFDNFNIDKFGSAQLLQQTLRWLVSARP